ncbi:MAG TPA: hypothetical protein DCR35_13350 [Runella sp.]|nr:hypothetical protein [Runella sp.]HAO50191.1 hypothetical protein [Runella sp.]
MNRNNAPKNTAPITLKIVNIAVKWLYGDVYKPCTNRMTIEIKNYFNEFRFFFELSDYAELIETFQVYNAIDYQVFIPKTWKVYFA